MATAPRQRATREVDYPTSDGKPMAETELHRQGMIDLIETLGHRFADNPNIHVSGNLLLYYEEGNRRKHVAPDVMITFGIPKNPLRDYYLVWKEGKAPDAVIEITSKSTQREDKHTKKTLYRDVLKVTEYFQFDPTEDYLKPPLQGFRLVNGDYIPIQPVNGRIPSQVLGLHLERDGTELRLVDPVTGLRLLTRAERIMEQAERITNQAERITNQAERITNQAEWITNQAERIDVEKRLREAAEVARDEERRLREAAEAERQRIAADFDRLRLELEAIRRRSNSE
jgi:Uma2 family endonuclease